MARRIMLVPISTGVGLTSVSVGLVRALEQKTVKVNFFKPIAQPRAGETGPEKSTQIVTQDHRLSRQHHLHSITQSK